MKTKAILSIISVLLTSSLVAAEVDISGIWSGGLNKVHTPESVTTQFDSALNIDVNKTLTDEWHIVAQLQASPGGSALSYPGPEAALTDVGIAYTPYHNKFNIVMGSYDTPFGQYTDILTNNADSSRNFFITNPLMYSRFAGIVGTLNTIGTKFESDYKDITWTASVSNGSNEDSQNDAKMGMAVRATKYIPQGYLSASYMNSTDSVEGSFNTAFTGLLLDAQYSPITDLTLRTYAGQLTYDDNSANTTDTVTTYMIEGQQNIGKIILMGRADTWIPTKHKKNADAGTDIPAAGIGNKTNQTVTRYSLSAGIPIEDNITLKAELFLEQHKQDETTAKGLLLHTTVQF